MSFSHLLGQKMKFALSAAYKQVQPLVMNFQDEILRRDPFHHRRKVVFVMGATGTGKSKLAIDLAMHHRGEVINSDKMQVYKGLDIVTNKVTEEECKGIPHHLLGFVDPDLDFDALDFRCHTSKAVQSIQARSRVPIVAGGSNSFIDALVNKDMEFKLRHECCFLWVDVELSVLESFVSERVDRMVKAGLVDEVRSIYDPEADNSKGVRRAIGVGELDDYFRLETSGITDDGARARALEASIAKIKDNTRILARRQVQKIDRLNSMWNWSIHRIDATEVFLRQGRDADETWQRLVAGPSAMIVDRFLSEERRTSIARPSVAATTSIISPPIPLAAVAAATH